MPKTRATEKALNRSSGVVPRRRRNSAAWPAERSARPVIPVLCRFWREEGVWNGIAQDIAVAVCGSSFEEAREHLRCALESHFDSAEETGEAEQVLAHLQERARDYQFFSLEEIAPDSALVKMQVVRKSESWVASA